MLDRHVKNNHNKPIDNPNSNPTARVRDYKQPAKSIASWCSKASIRVCDLATSSHKHGAALCRLFRFGLWGISVQCIQGTNKTEDQDTPSDATRQWWRLLPLHCCSQSLSRLHVLIAKILGLSFHHCSDRKFSHIHC